MPRGQKQCGNCGEFTGPRTKICPKCNTPFIIKGSSVENVEDSYISNDSFSIDEEIHFTTTSKKCAYCEETYSHDSKRKDCYGNTAFVYNNGLYCSKFCLRQASVKIGEIALKLKRGLKLDTEQLDLLSILENREQELKEFKQILGEYPSITFRIRPEKVRPFTSAKELVDHGLKVPISSDYQQKVADNDQEEPPLTFADLKAEFTESVKEEKEENHSPPEPPPSLKGFAGLFSKNKPAIEIQTKSSKINYGSPGRGQKKCKGCGACIGVRSLKCKHCGHPC